LFARGGRSSCLEGVVAGSMGLEKHVLL
jgi:hypothetical protein